MESEIYRDTGAVGQEDLEAGEEVCRQDGLIPLSTFKIKSQNVTIQAKKGSKIIH